MIRDDAIVAALAAGLSYREAAKRGGASSHDVVVQRMKSAEFRAWVEEAKFKSHDLQRVYTALDRAREAWSLVQGIDEDKLDTTVQEALRHLKSSVEWLDEWVYILEEECAS